jgi:hypothetical protein
VRRVREEKQGTDKRGMLHERGTIRGAQNRNLGERSPHGGELIKRWKPEED